MRTSNESMRGVYYKAASPIVEDYTCRISASIIFSQNWLKGVRPNTVFIMRTEHAAKESIKTTLYKVTDLIETQIEIRSKRSTNKIRFINDRAISTKHKNDYQIMNLYISLYASYDYL